MDETKIELPAWLPWATTACLAALVACVGELWIVERARNQLERDERRLEEASLKAAQNQLEAERIVDRREIEELGASAAELLAAPGATADSPFAGRPWGVARWNGAAGTVLVRFSGLPAPASGRDYQLWIDGAGAGFPQDCGVVQAPQDGDPGALVVRLGGPVPRGSRILLIDGKKGGARTLAEAQAGGSIVLASLPRPGKITN
jgi:hypothetical protein